jgi:hypothetical protein
LTSAFGSSVWSALAVQVPPGDLPQLRMDDGEPAIARALSPCRQSSPPRPDL